MSFENKVVLVTGAGFPDGIGAGIASCFVNEKAKVFITDLEGAPIDEAAAAISGNVTSLIADAASQEAMGEAADQIIEQYGRIDVLVNNAGVTGALPEDEEAAGAAFMSDQIWDKWLVTNLRTAYSSSIAVAPKMEDGGSIVNIASIAAIYPKRSVDQPAYGAAKAAVAHLTKIHASQFASRRIRINCVCPGVVWTRSLETALVRLKKSHPRGADMSLREYFDRYVAPHIPLGSEQTAEDIGNLAVFFASDKAQMITGAVVAVDGGITL